MNTITMPGFTADASVHVDSGRYIAVERTDSAGLPVQAQWDVFTPFVPGGPIAPDQPGAIFFQPRCYIRRKQIFNYEKRRWVTVCEKVCSNGTVGPWSCYERLPPEDRI